MREWRDRRAVPAQPTDPGGQGDGLSLLGNFRPSGNLPARRAGAVAAGRPGWPPWPTPRGPPQPDLDATRISGRRRPSKLTLSLANPPAAMCEHKITDSNMRPVPPGRTGQANKIS